MLGIVWGWNCWRHRSEILPVQNYISATIAFIAVEMAVVSGYYKYVNDIGQPTVTHIFLLIGAVSRSEHHPCHC